jgi:hypothetical protein
VLRDFEGPFVGCGSIATELMRRNELTLYRSSTLIRGAVRCRKVSSSLPAAGRARYGMSSQTRLPEALLRRTWASK